MTEHSPQEFLDTVQIAPKEEAKAVDAADATANAAQADFAATVQIEGQVWPEAPDFQGSESASLFAGTQPGKLNVV